MAVAVPAQSRFGQRFCLCPGVRERRQGFPVVAVTTVVEPVARVVLEQTLTQVRVLVESPVGGLVDGVPAGDVVNIAAIVRVVPPDGW